MKKFVSLFTVISLVLSMVVMGALSVSAAWDGTTVATSFASGTGTEADPYVVKTPEQLAYLAQSVKGGETYEGKLIVLGADIDLGSSEWLPIGLYKYENTSGNDFPFKGSFDGKGYTVSNFAVTAGNNTVYAGLFAYVTGENSVIKNLVVESANVAGKNYAGVVVAKFQGKEISNIEVKTGCTVTGTASVGGVAGRIVGGEGKYLVNGATVTGTGNSNSSFIGGICGALGGDAKLSYCVNKGVIGGDVAFSGGIVGITGSDSGAGDIENCYNTGEITYTGSKNGRYVGGIAARLSNVADETYSVKNSYNLGVLAVVGTGTCNVGELAAEIKNGGVTVENFYSVDLEGFDFVPEGKSNAATVLTNVVNKTSAEIKVLTDAIDKAIEDNKVTPPVASDTTPSTPDTTAPSTPDTTKPTTTPETGDVSAVILAAVCVTGLAAVMVAKKKER